MKVQYRNICSIRQAEVEFPLGKLVSIRGETNAGKSALFYGLLAGFTNSPEFKKFINIYALKDNPKDFAWIGIFDENGNQFQVEAGTNYLYYRTNDAKYEKVGRKNIFELMDGQIPGLLYDPDDTRVIMNIQGEDDGFFPIDRTDSQIFKTYERLLSLSNTSEVLNTIKSDMDDLDIRMTSTLTAIQQYAEKSSKIDKVFENVSIDTLQQSIVTLEALVQLNDELTLTYNSIKNIANYLKRLSQTPVVEEQQFDVLSFQQQLAYLIKSNASIKYIELTKKTYDKQDFDVSKAIELAQDFSVANELIKQINEFETMKNKDIEELQRVSNIMDNIKVCPLCGKPMEACND